MATNNYPILNNKEPLITEFIDDKFIESNKLFNRLKQELHSMHLQNTDDQEITDILTRLLNLDHDFKRYAISQSDQNK